jgi:hypothetical protein
MDFSTLLQQLVNGVQSGAIYALIAVGYTMVYSIVCICPPPAGSPRFARGTAVPPAGRGNLKGGVNRRCFYKVCFGDWSNSGGAAPIAPLHHRSRLSRNRARGVVYSLKKERGRLLGLLLALG